jgi:BirA family biotin operon repressor/biotin-[acetyl-CoA-carboxylase] ligase
MVGAGPGIAFDGMPPEVLASRLGVAQCILEERVTSTLDVVHQLARDGAPDGTVVLAEEQAAGRGRHGRQWLSAPHAGILLGYLKRPARAPESGVTALRVGMALRSSLLPLGVEGWIKWPNDLMVCDRKLAGVLCEARQSDGTAPWIAIGIGLNVRGPLRPEIARQAVSLDELLPEVTRIDVLERLAPLLRHLPDTNAMNQDELRDYARCDWLMGRQLSRPVAGTARGVAADGALLVETLDGVQRVMGGSVVTA